MNVVPLRQNFGEVQLVPGPNVGSEAKVRDLAGTMQLDLGTIQIVDIDDNRTAALQAVELARKGGVQMLMKGSLHTDELMSAVVSREGGMRTRRRISHVFALNVPSYHKTLFVTDAAVNIQPDLETKVDILQNAIDMMLTLEVVNPKVAILSAVESVNPAIPSTLGAAALCSPSEPVLRRHGLLTRYFARIIWVVLAPSIVSTSFFSRRFALLPNFDSKSE